MVDSVALVANCCRNEFLSAMVQYDELAQLVDTMATRAQPAPADSSPPSSPSDVDESSQRTSKDLEISSLPTGEIHSAHTSSDPTEGGSSSNAYTTSAPAPASEVHPSLDEPRDHSKEQEEECCICLEPLCRSGNSRRTQVATSCGHHFHPVCLATFLASRPKSSCPMCRCPSSQLVPACSEDGDCINFLVKFTSNMNAVERLHQSYLCTVESRVRNYEAESVTFLSKVATATGMPFHKVCSPPLSLLLLHFSLQFLKRHNLAGNTKAS